MSERPIIFSAPMIREILAGLKTQTRRIIKPQPSAEAKEAGVIHSGNPDSNGIWAWLDHPDLMEAGFTKDKEFRCPYGVPGDRLWVRETWQQHPDAGCDFVSVKVPPDAICYAADMTEAQRKECGPWIPSIHMPRAASRIQLIVIDVRVQRLQSISQQDAIAEGIHRVGQRWEAEGICTTPESAADAFRGLWNYIHGSVPWAPNPSSWEANPWVWAVSFERAQDQRKVA